MAMASVSDEENPVVQYVVTTVTKLANIQGYLFSKFFSRVLTFPFHRITISASLGLVSPKLQNLRTGFGYHILYHGSKLIYDQLCYRNGPLNSLHIVLQILVSNGLSVLTLRSIRQTQMPTLKTPIFWYFQGVIPLICIHISVLSAVRLLNLDDMPHAVDLLVCRIISYPFRRVYFARASVHSEATTISQYFFEEFNSLKSINNFSDWRSWAGLPFDVIEASFTEIVRTQIQKYLAFHLRPIIFHIWAFLEQVYSNPK